MEKKITRSRNGCFTCKKRRRKCDETKPYCKNCTDTGRVCAGYGVRLVFDVDDSRNSNATFNQKGEKKHGFRGRPKINNLENSFIVNNTPNEEHVHDHTQDHDHHDEHIHKDKRTFVKPKLEIISSINFPSKITKLESPTSSSKHIKSLISFSASSSSNNTAPTTNIETMMKPENIDSTPSNSPNLLVSRESSTNTVLSNSLLSKPNTKQANTASSTSERDFELDFNDPQQFEHAFFSGLDYILDNYDTDLLNSVDFSFMPGMDNNNGLDINNQMNGNGHLNIPISPTYHNINMTPVSPLMNNHTSALTNMQQYSDLQNNNQQPQQFNNELELDSSNLGPKLKKKEESLILKHFFEKVIYLLDAHPHNPWPQLMMKFGSMDLAKSCFLSLSSMHLYVNNGGDEFYKKGLLHINNTMEYLIKYVKTGSIASKKPKQKKIKSESSSSDDNENENGDENADEEEEEEEGDGDGGYQELKGTSDVDLNVPKIISKIKSESNKKKGTNFMVILLLLYVHLLFAVLESGRSALARMFLKLSSSIASDPIFNKKIKKIPQSQSLLCVLSWFDTVSALVSPDCRIPYCDPKWFGESSDIISTDKMNGCPVGMFRVLYDLCIYRRKMMILFSQQECYLQDMKTSYKSLMDLRDRCLHYRDHVLFILPHGSSFTYIDRLKCAQLWSLSAVLVTLQLELHYFSKLNKFVEYNRDMISGSEFPDAVPTVHIYSEKATAIVTEFLSVYNTIPSSSPIITQMVWPIFYVAICSSTEENRTQSWEALKTLYETVKMGTIKSNMDIVQRVWDEGCSLESILVGEGWLEAGIDLLPC